MTIRIGVLSDSKMAKWKLEALKRTVSSSNARITLVIIDDRDPDVTVDHLSSIISGNLWTIYNKISWKINPPKLRSSEALADWDIFEDAEFHYCEPHPADPIGSELPDEVVKLASEKCDVLFRSGFGILQGDILSVTEYGILSYHSGDIQKYRGKPPGFWEFYNNENFCGITLQRLTETLDGGEIAVYKDVKISNLNTWEKVRHRLDTEAIDMLSTAISQIEDNEYDPHCVDSLGELYTVPNNLETLRFIIKNTCGFFDID